MIPQTIKAVVWGTGGFAFGAVTHPMMAQITHDIPTLPTQWEAGVMGFTIALLVWALRRSDAERIADAKGYAEDVKVLAQSKTQHAENYANSIDAVRRDLQAFTLQLHSDLMDELRHNRKGESE